MGGDAGDTLQKMAGYGVGTLAALTSIKGGGLQNYFLNRQRFLADPASRATLLDSPFTAGTFLTGGSEEPAGPGSGMPAAAAVAKPGDAVPAAAAAPAVAGPSDLMFLAGQTPGRHYIPSVNPLSAEQQVGVQAAQGIVSGLQSSDPTIRAQAKLAGKVPLTTEETLAATQGATKLQRTLSAGSTVGLQIPGMPIEIGSPYATGTYLDENAAKVLAARTGGVVVPSPTGGFDVKTPERPVEGEYTSPGEAAAARQPNEVTKPTGRTVNGVPTYFNVKQEPTGVAPLGAAKPPAAAKPTPPAPVVPAPPPQAEKPAAAPAPPPAPPPESQAAPTPEAPPALPPHEVVRRLPDGSFAPVKPPAPPAPPRAAEPRAEVTPPTGAPLLAAAAPPLFQFPGQPTPEAAAPVPVMVARATPPPYQLVPGSELSGIASGAPPAPAEERLPTVPASPVPFPQAIPGQPAPQAAAGAPAGIAPGAQTFTETQPIKPELGGGTVTSSGETPAALDLKRREQEISLDTERRFGRIPETKPLNALYLVRSLQNDLVNEFTPEQRASYVGYVTPYLREFVSGNDPKYQRFLTLNGQISSALLETAQSGAQFDTLSKLLPTGTERTPAEYENALRGSVDTVDKLIAGQSALANMHTVDLTPPQQQKLIGTYLSGPATVHFGPYPWDTDTGEPIARQSTTTSARPTTTTSPFLVDRMYTVQPPPRR